MRSARAFLRPPVLACSAPRLTALSISDTSLRCSTVICSFWLVSALVAIGEVARARTLCGKLLAASSSLQLYAEEIDPHSGRHLGNFPQAFTHLALINAVMHVIRADEKLAKGIQPLSAQDPTVDTLPPAI